MKTNSLRALGATVAAVALTFSIAPAASAEQGSLDQAMTSVQGITGSAALGSLMGGAGSLGSLQQIVDPQGYAAQQFKLQMDMMMTKGGAKQDAAMLPAARTALESVLKNDKTSGFTFLVNDKNGMWGAKKDGATGYMVIGLPNGKIADFNEKLLVSLFGTPDVAGNTGVKGSFDSVVVVKDGFTYYMMAGK